MWLVGAAAYVLAPNGTPPAGAADRAFTLPAGVLGELSGMATSLAHPGVVYMNNDSGNTNEAFAIDTATGAIRARLTVAGTTNTDWEAIAVGRDEQGRPAVFVGDIGGNFGRTTVLVHRFVEPATLATGTVQPTTFQLSYPAGVSTDAESLLLDQTTGQLYIASKAGPPTPGRLFRAPRPLASGTLTDTGRTTVPTWATDGAYAPGGTSYAIRSGGPLGPNTAFVFDANGVQLAQVALPAQPQGEAMTYVDCRTLLVGSENDTQVWSVPLPEAAIPAGSCGPPTTTTSTTAPSTTTTTVPGSTTTTTTLPTTTTSTTVPSTTTTTAPSSLTVANPGDQRSRFFQQVSLPIRVTGGTPPVTCTATGLPPTLWMDTATCTIVGWATRIGDTTVRVTATDSLGHTGTTTFRWSIVWI
jgi:hypothetical protein